MAPYSAKNVLESELGDLKDNVNEAKDNFSLYLHAATSIRWRNSGHEVQQPCCNYVTLLF